MSLILLTGLVFGFAALSVPIAFSLGAAGIIYILIEYPEMLPIITQRIWAGTNNFVVIALPLFMIAGEIMNRGGITRRIVDLSIVIVRVFKGGLAEVNIVASMIFGGLSGSSVADTSAIGSTLIPQMKRMGYPQDFSTGVTVASSTMGQIIPPSIPMLMFALVSGASVARLFVAGIIPGLLVGVSQIIVAFLISRNKGYHKLHTITSTTVSRRSVVESIIALLMPIMIVLSVSFGIATATESAGLAVLYAVILGRFVYKELRVPDVVVAIKKAVIMTSAVMLIIAYTMILTYVLAREQVPLRIAEAMLSLDIGRNGFLFLYIVLLLLSGTFIDVTPAIVLFTPIFLPVAGTYGISSIHFGLMMIVGLGIGLVTPPIGMCLNAGTKVSGLPVLRIFVSALPFLLCNLLVLLLVAYIPWITEALPSLISR